MTIFAPGMGGTCAKPQQRRSVLRVESGARQPFVCADRMHVSPFLDTGSPGAGTHGQYDAKDRTWIVHLWLVNDDVDPPTYLHVPAVVDTGCEGDLTLPLREAQKLGLEEDRLMPRQNMIDATGHATPIIIYKPITALVPMLDRPGGRLDFYKAGRLQLTSLRAELASEQGHSPAAAQADQDIKAAGQAAIDRIKDKSGAWVQLSPAIYPRHDSNLQYPLLGLAGMDRLGLQLDRENRAIRTARMRTIVRADD